jgi:glycosyltransferase involved in cell wall biosynthesis
MIKLPKVTVLMPIYNGAEFLVETLDSIFKQTYKDFELLIINDCSSDVSIDIINSFKDSRVRIINNKTNIGQTRSLNKGIELAQGEYIAIHDQDDISKPERLFEQVEFLNLNTNIPVIGTYGEEIDENGRIINACDIAFSSDTIFIKLLMGSSPFIHSSVMFRRKVIIEEFNGYNESYRFFQDYELWARVLKKYKLANIDNNCVQHRMHSTAASEINRERCNYEAIKVQTEFLYDFLDNSNLKGVNEYFSTLRYFKPVVHIDEILNITDKIVITYNKKYGIVNNYEFNSLIANVYYKIADIYSGSRIASYKAFKLYRKYTPSRIAKVKYFRLLFLWIGGSEIRQLYRKYKFIKKTCSYYF